MDCKFRTLLVDPPWPETIITGFKGRHKAPQRLPYPTMTVEEIRSLPIPDYADTNAHLWLWTTNRTLPDGFDLMKHWGFKYMMPVHWVKPSGFGAWWIHRTQTVLFGYRGKLDMRERLKPNVLFENPVRHSQKPGCSYELIEAVSHPTRLELFARKKRSGWSAWGNEVESDISLSVKQND